MDGIGAGLRRLLLVLALLWKDATRSYRLQLLFVLALLAATAVLTALGPVALKLVVDALAGEPAEASGSLALLVALYVTALWLARAIAEVRGFIFVRVERRLFRTLCERLFDHVIRLPLVFHAQRRTGAVNQALESGLQGYYLVLQQLVFSILPIVVELTAVIVVLGRVDQGEFLLLFLIALVSYGVAFGIAAKRAASPAAMASMAHLDATAVMTDGMLNYEAIKLFAAEDMIRRRVSDALARTESGWIDFFTRYSLNGLVVSLIFAAFLALTSARAAMAVQAGEMSVGTFVLINSYVLQLVRPVELLGLAVQGLTRGLAMMKGMIELLAEPTESTPELPGGPLREPVLGRFKEQRSAEGALAFRNVSFSYGPDRIVLRNVSFTLQPGRTLGIVGATGAGKSTLVRLLVRLVAPDDGTILLNGEPISQQPLPYLRQMVGVVPQDVTLLNDTIAFNIRLGRPTATQEEIVSAARVANLHDFIMALPENYQTVVGERGVRLSGGERQRVAIARAVLKRPYLYVFDEGTSALDAATEAAVLRSFKEDTRAHSTLMITHRLSSIAHADVIIVLDQGMIVEQGNHAELIELNGLYHQLWRAQQCSGRTVSI
jgi:ABC-type transport system involved in Fe-S cluster assembly fused permease/ATPase subunit